MLGILPSFTFYHPANKNKAANSFSPCKKGAEKMPPKHLKLLCLVDVCEKLYIAKRGKREIVNEMRISGSDL